MCGEGAGSLAAKPEGLLLSFSCSVLTPTLGLKKQLVQESDYITQYDGCK